MRNAFDLKLNEQLNFSWHNKKSRKSTKIRVLIQTMGFGDITIFTRIIVFRNSNMLSLSRLREKEASLT